MVDDEGSYPSAMHDALYRQRDELMKTQSSPKSGEHYVILDPQTRRQLRRLELAEHLHNKSRIEELGKAAASKPKSPLGPVDPAFQPTEPVAGGVRTKLRKSGSEGAAKLDEELSKAQASFAQEEELDRQAAAMAADVLRREANAAIKLQSIHRGRAARAAISEDYQQWTSPVGGGSNDPIDTHIAMGIAKCSRLQSEWMADESNEMALNAYLASLLELEGMAEEMYEDDIGLPIHPHHTMGETADSKRQFTFAEIVEKAMVKVAARNLANRRRFDDMLGLGGVEGARRHNDDDDDLPPSSLLRGTDGKARVNITRDPGSKPKRNAFPTPFGDDNETLYMRNAAGAIGNDSSVFGNIGQIGGKAVGTAQRTVGGAIKLPVRIVESLLCMSR